MKRILPLLALILSTLSMAAVRADDQTRNVQTQLKDQGFYYGEVDGKSSAELSAAVRRYQIRNGLEVSGDLNKETLGALGLGPSAPAAAANPPASHSATRSNPVPEPKTHPPVNIRRDDRDADAGDARPAPVESVRPRDPHNPAVVPPPAPLDENAATVPGPNANYARAFAGTPYAVAPRVVQESTMRRAQQGLADRGFYRDPIDGQPGPATEEAVLSYQRSARLPLTGKLDLQTLATLRLLPGSGRGNPPLKPFNAPDAGPAARSTRPVYRGVWVE